MVRGTRSRWAAGVVVAASVLACSGARRSPPGSGGADRGDEPARLADAAAAPREIDAPPLDAGPAMVARPPDPDAVVAILAREPAVMIVERRGAVIAMTPAGKELRVLAAAPARRAQYDRWHVVWLLRGARLIAIDLERAAPTEVIVAEDLPDLEVLVSLHADLEREYCPGGCVSIRAAAVPAIGVAPDGPQVPAAPRLTDAGRALLAELAVRPLAGETPIALGAAIAPLPPSERRRPSCAYPDTCGRGFAVPGIARTLLVVGRTCDCARDACHGLCVWLDPARPRYASVRRPARWLADAPGEPACHPRFSADGRAYVLGGDVSPGPLAACTAAGCTPLAGRFLGWLEPGLVTSDLSEDQAGCPE